MNVLSTVFVDARELLLHVCVAMLRILRLDRVARFGANAAKTLLAPWPLWSARYDNSDEDARTIKAIEDEQPSQQQQEGGQSPREEPSTTRLLSPFTVDDKGVSTYEALPYDQQVKPTIIDEVKFPGIDIDERPEENGTFDVVYGAVQKAVMQTVGRVQDVVEDVVAPPFMVESENQGESEENVVESTGDVEEHVAVGTKRKESSAWDGGSTCPKRPKPEQETDGEAAASAYSGGGSGTTRRSDNNEVRAEDTSDRTSLDESSGLAAVLDGEGQRKEDRAVSDGEKPTGGEKKDDQPSTPLGGLTTRTEEGNRIPLHEQESAAAQTMETRSSSQDATPRWEESSGLAAALEDATDGHASSVLKEDLRDTSRKAPTVLPREESTDEVRGRDSGVAKTKEVTRKAQNSVEWEESSGVALRVIENDATNDRSLSHEEEPLHPPASVSADAGDSQATTSYDESSGLEAPQLVASHGGSSLTRGDRMDLTEDQASKQDTSQPVPPIPETSTATESTSSMSRGVGCEEAPVPSKSLEQSKKELVDEDAKYCASASNESSTASVQDDSFGTTEWEESSGVEALRLAPSGQHDTMEAMSRSLEPARFESLLASASDRDSSKLGSLLEELSGVAPSFKALSSIADDTAQSTPMQHDELLAGSEEKPEMGDAKQQQKGDVPIEESSGLAAAYPSFQPVEAVGYLPTPTDEMVKEATKPCDKPLATHDFPSATETAMEETHSEEIARNEESTTPTPLRLEESSGLAAAFLSPSSHEVLTTEPRSRSDEEPEPDYTVATTEKSVPTETLSWLRIPSYELEESAAAEPYPSKTTSQLTEIVAASRPDSMGRVLTKDGEGDRSVDGAAKLPSSTSSMETPEVHRLALTSPSASAFTIALRGASGAAFPSPRTAFDDLFKPIESSDTPRGQGAVEQATPSDKRPRGGSNDTEDTESDRHLEDVDSPNEEEQDEGEDLAIRNAQGKVLGVLAHVIKVDEVVMEEDEPPVETTATRSLVVELAQSSSEGSSDDAWSSDEFENDEAFASVPPALGKRVISAVYFTI